MIQRYYPALVRFGGTLLAGGLLLRLLAGRFSHGVTSTVGIYYRTPLGTMVQEALFGVADIAGRGLAIALPAALALGLAAGLRPGWWPDRITSALAVLLAGLPALPAVLAIVCLTTLDLGWMGQEGALHLALALVSFPWLALSIRRSVAALALEGGRLHPARAITAIFGAVLGQAGNLALAALAAGVYLLPDTGLLRLLELGSRLNDPVLLYTLVAPAIALLALLHLAGESLETFAGGQHAEPQPPLPWAKAAGVLLLLGGLWAFIPYPAEATNLWIITLGAVFTALLGGMALALLGPLTPRVTTPSLLAPILLGCLLPVAAAPTLLVQILAIGLGCAVTLAGPIRRLAHAHEADQRPAAIAAGGALLLTAGQALSAQITLSILNVGLPDRLASLGHVVRDALLADPGAQSYGPVLLVLAMSLGLFLLGFSLQLPEQQVPVELPEDGEAASESAGAD